MARTIVITKAAQKSEKNASKPAPKTIAMSEDKQWQARCDLRALQEAEAITSDKARLAAAKKEAQDQVKAIQSVVAKK